MRCQSLNRHHHSTCLPQTTNTNNRRFSTLTTATSSSVPRPPSSPPPPPQQQQLKNKQSTRVNTVQLSPVLVADDNGPPRLASPLPSPDAPLPLAGRSSLPFLLYLPGIDGTGLAAARQFPRLLSRFDLVTLITPPTDRTPFTELVDIVVHFLQAEVPLHTPTRPIYVLGESFGGVLALAVAAKAPELVDRLILVNPATSFEDSLWPIIGPLLPQVPTQLYQALPIALAPVLGNPINLLAAALDDAAAAEDGNGTGSNNNTEQSKKITDQMSALVRGAVQLLSQLPLLATLLPPDTLAWKLHLLKEGCIAVSPLLVNNSISQRTLIVVGDQDLMIPSKEEGPRLQKALPRAHVRVERGRSHALLQEGGVDLVSILEEEGALVYRRRMSAPLKKRERGTGFGTAGPIELPTEIELKRYGERTTALGRRLSSPVFMSTSADGVVGLGLEHVPASGLDGPVLYVGNHQTLALDLGVLCEEFLKERGIMLRGLAHPVIFSDMSVQQQQIGGGRSSSARERKARGGGLSPFDVIPAFGQFLARGGPANSNNNNSSIGGSENGRQAFADFMVEFGAVPVSARNLVRLLQNGESVLLFPGGVREAYRRKGEEYQLFWPERAEFVRMAAKYGAKIVPFSAIGVDDSLEIVLDGDELQRTPVIGDMVKSRAAALPQARRGVKALDEGPESFISPLAVPKLPPSRLYFLFHRPIEVEEGAERDRERCEEVYRQVKGEVGEGLQTLLRRRKEDPYADFGKRVVWETVNGGKQAPTYKL